MVSTQNTSRNHANPPRMPDQEGDIDSRPPGGTLETLHANTDEMEALRLTNQSLLRELEQLTRKMQHPQEAQQAREGQNPITQEEQQHLDPPREADGERLAKLGSMILTNPSERISMRTGMAGTIEAMGSSSRK